MDGLCEREVSKMEFRGKKGIRMKDFREYCTAHESVGTLPVTRPCTVP